MDSRPGRIPLALIQAHQSRGTDPILFGARVVFILVVLAILSCSARGQTKTAPNCDLRAAPPPLATYGGPTTAGRGHTELGVALGAFGEGFGDTCFTDFTGATDWFARWRHGVTDRSDLGFDVLTSDEANGNLESTTKVAARYRATRGLRLEGGVGTSDGGDGRSINADVGAVIGTNRHPDNTWNYYASLRVAGSHGCFNLLCAGGMGAAGSRPPGAIIPLGVIGSTARVSDTTHFVMEAGLGDIQSRQQPNTGLYVHLSFGVLFNVGRDRKAR
jgi:hypothetical protein